MKHIFYYMVFCLIINQTFSQAMVYPGSVWYQIESMSFWYNEIAYSKTVYTADTIIHNETFHLLKTTRYQNNGLVTPIITEYVKSDSDRVWVWYPEIDTTFLFYDFSAAVGATWPVKYYSDKWYLVNDYFTVISKDTVIMNGRPLRRYQVGFTTGATYCGSKHEITERLGSFGSVLLGRYSPDAPTVCRNCYYDYNWPITKEFSTDCTYTYTDFQKLNNSDERISIFKSVHWNWKIPEHDSNGLLLIFDSSGREVLKLSIKRPEGDFSIDTQGVYFWNYISDEGRIEFGRIIN